MHKIKTEIWDMWDESKPISSPKYKAKTVNQQGMHGRVSYYYGTITGAMSAMTVSKDCMYLIFV